MPVPLSERSEKTEKKKQNWRNTPPILLQLVEKPFRQAEASFAAFKKAAKLKIKQAKDTPDGFLSHYLPFRKSDLNRFFDRQKAELAEYSANSAFCI